MISVSDFLTYGGGIILLVVIWFSFFVLVNEQHKNGLGMNTDGQEYFVLTLFFIIILLITLGILELFGIHTITKINPYN